MFSIAQSFSIRGSTSNVTLCCCVFHNIIKSCPRDAFPKQFDYIFSIFENDREKSFIPSDINETKEHVNLSKFKRSCSMFISHNPQEADFYVARSFSHRKNTEAAHS